MSNPTTSNPKMSNSTPNSKLSEDLIKSKLWIKLVISDIEQSNNLIKQRRQKGV